VLDCNLKRERASGSTYKAKAREKRALEEEEGREIELEKYQDSELQGLRSEAGVCVLCQRQ
jgi:hypothetical protein